MLQLRLFFVLRKTPLCDPLNQILRQCFVIRQTDRTFTHTEAFQFVFEHSCRSISGIQSDMLFKRRKVNDISPLPICGHRPGNTFISIRQCSPQNSTDLIQFRLYRYILYSNILIYALRLNAIVILILSAEFPAAFWTFPFHFYTLLFHI